jgi:hypothetical protein
LTSSGQRLPNSGTGNSRRRSWKGAIEQAVDYLADHSPRDQDDVSAVLSRFCRQEVSRRRKERNQFIFIDFTFASETPWSYTPFSAADAAIDVERILRDAPPNVREAMLMRYGSSESWNDFATPATCRFIPALPESSANRTRSQSLTTGEVKNRIGQANARRRRKGNTRRIEIFESSNPRGRGVTTNSSSDCPISEFLKI